MSESQKHVAVIEIVESSNKMKGRRVEHKGIPFIIGRAPQVDLFIPDPKVSKNHAVIEKRGESYYIVDLDSKNGTLVNGERLLRPEGVRLEHDDTIQIGETKLKFYRFEGLGDAELQAIQKRITFNAIQKYSNRSAVMFCEIPEFRELYVKYTVSEVDAARDKFLKVFMDIIREGGPYFFEPRGDKAIAFFETASAAFDFSKTLLRRMAHMNINLLRDPQVAIKKIELRVAIVCGPLSLVLGDDGRIDKVTGTPISAAKALCETTASGELWVTQDVFNDIPAPQRIGLEELNAESKFGKIYRYLSDTTAFF